jgi:hypothetical protein
MAWVRTWLNKLQLEARSPPPDVIWMKDGRVQQPSDYFQILDKKHLRILGLMEGDAGMYQCFGNNTIGNIQGSMEEDYRLCHIGRLCRNVCEQYGWMAAVQILVELKYIMVIVVCYGKIS